MTGAARDREVAEAVLVFAGRAAAHRPLCQTARNAYITTTTV